MAADGSIPWIGQAAGRWGHWGATWLIVSISAAIALGVWPPPAGSSIALLLPVTVFAVVIASWLAMRQHDRRLCEACAWAMPLNAAEVAARYQSRFAVAHAGQNRPLVFAYLIVLLGSNVVLVDGLAGRIGWAIVQSSMIYLVLAYSSHRRFQPWCSRCDGGGGGDDRVEVPDPVPHGGRSR